MNQSKIYLNYNFLLDTTNIISYIATPFIMLLKITGEVSAEVSTNTQLKCEPDA